MYHSLPEFNFLFTHRSRNHYKFESPLQVLHEPVLRLGTEKTSTGVYELTPVFDEDGRRASRQKSGHRPRLTGTGTSEMKHTHVQTTRFRQLSLSRQ